MPLLTCKNVAVGYDGKKIAEGFSFSVDEGDYLCIVGENGAGKSTLMKTLLRLIPPVGGEIIAGDGMKRSDIGYLPQQTQVQRDFPASVREIVLSGCLNRSKLHPFYSAEEKRLAAENLEKLGIAELSGHSYRELSGGQQQRVLLARALCASRRLLLLDEPAAGLDPLAMTEMYTLIEKLNKDENIAIIMITHDIPAAKKYASHILHVGEKPLFFGTVRDYIESGAGLRLAEGGNGNA